MSEAGIAALNRVAETNVVVRSSPFQRTTELVTNLLPLTVSVNPALPALAVVGLKLEIVGTRLLIVRVNALEVPPPGAGVNTVTGIVPANAMSEAGIAALNRVAETNVVVRSSPFQRTTELVTNLLPLTVSVNAAPPAVRDEGLKLVVVGRGLSGTLIVKVWPLEVPPPGVGLKTVTLAVPAVAMSAARIDAVTWVALTYVVVRFVPFHLTTELEMKLVPFTVSVKADPPAVAELGLRLVVVGRGLSGTLIVKVWALEVPPPGVGLKTVTLAVPAVAMSAAAIEAVSWVALT
jgi:hypothetical protein